MCMYLYLSRDIITRSAIYYLTHYSQKNLSDLVWHGRCWKVTCTLRYWVCATSSFTTDQHRKLCWRKEEKVGDSEWAFYHLHAFMLYRVLLLYSNIFIPLSSFYSCCIFFLLILSYLFSLFTHAIIPSSILNLLFYPSPFPFPVPFLEPLLLPLISPPKLDHSQYLSPSTFLDP